MVASEVLMGAPQYGTRAVNFVVVEEVAHHEHRQDQPAMSSGIPKIRPMVAP